MLRTATFADFRAAIATLPVKARYEKADLLRPKFRLFIDRGLDVYYIPFHRMNQHARIVLLGLTPGWTQMELAYRTARTALTKDLDDEAILKTVELAACFGGPMRKNLIEMLDGVGINEWLGIGSSDGLFGRNSQFVHFTAAITAPTFKNSANYTGYGPPPLASSLVRRFIAANLVPELNEIPRAIVVAFGKVAGEVLFALRAEGEIDPSSLVLNLPHPSGANGHRKLTFARSKQRWRDQLFARRATV